MPSPKVLHLFHALLSPLNSVESGRRIFRQRVESPARGRSAGIVRLRGWAFRAAGRIGRIRGILESRRAEVTTRRFTFRATRAHAESIHLISPPPPAPRP